MGFKFFFTLLKYSPIWLCMQVYAQQSDTSAIKNAIIRGNILYLSANLSSDKTNVPIDSNTPTPLILAIHAGQTKVVEFLINQKKADPNLRYKAISPLMHAVQTKGIKNIKILVKAGAKINAIDSVGNTVFMMAAIMQSPPLMRYLFRHGATLNNRNFAGYTATDIAEHAKNKKTEHFLRHLFLLHLPNYNDGPYIEYLPKHKVKVTYLIHDSVKHKFIKQTYITDIQTYTPPTPHTPKNNNFIPSSFKREPFEYNAIQKLLIIGDIHGQCDTLKKFLVANQIINDQLQWNFGAGHVVVLGDILDRGNQVTETIWLLYRLEQEAMQQGGKLHIILGNHELMIFKGDTRYIADKYSILSKNFSLPYQKLFSKKTVIGQWLRSKNTALKINDNLFIHGGLHPDFIKVKLSLDSINNVVYNYLNSKKKEIHPLPVYDLIFGEKGPFWFRGLITNKVIQEKDVDTLLKFYEVNHIFVGHTGLPKITAFYNDKVWGMDVPFYLYNGYPMEAIMIDANNIYLLNTSGMKTKIQTK
jgi:hypothetical protein